MSSRLWGLQCENCGRQRLCGHVEPTLRKQIGVGRMQRACESVIIEQRTYISRFKRIENVVRQGGKFEFNALINWKPMQILENIK